VTAQTINRTKSNRKEDRVDEGETAIPVEGPVGVKGWLLWFCLVLTVFNPLLTVYNLVSGYTQASPLFDRFPGFRVVTILDFVLSAGIVCFGIYAGIALWKKRDGAVRTAKGYLQTFLAYAVIESVLPFMAGLPSAANEVMLPEVLKSGFRGLVFFAIWYSYLNRSKRVKNTFPELSVADRFPANPAA
jgi:hypothetical protein